MRSWLSKMLGHHWRKFADSQRGVSAVEFALVLPLMLTLYIGCVELTQAISAWRQVTLAARTVADLVSQSTSVDSAQMSDIFSAAQVVIAPFNSNQMTVTVSSVSIDSHNNATIAWSRTNQGSPAHNPGDPVALPTALNVANTTLIWGEATYVNTPIIGGPTTSLFYKLTQNITLYDDLFMAPRLSASVACNSC